MASSTSFVFIVMASFAVLDTFNNIAPSLAQSLTEEICNEVECGKGRCQYDGSFPLGFSCRCDYGWKRRHDNGDDDDHFKFLPCVIPDCTLNYGSCQPSPPPVPDKNEVPLNISAFDPCYWAYCGEGRCTRNKTHTHTCECNYGFFNLLNIGAFPCYSECTLGSDCSRLGIKIANSTSSGGFVTYNHGPSSLPGKIQWVAILLMVSFGVSIYN